MPPDGGICRPALRAACGAAFLLAAGARGAVLRGRDAGRLTPSAGKDGQLGLALPSARNFGFHVPGAAPLVKIEVSDDAHVAAQSAAHEGASSLAVHADLASGRLSLRTEGAEASTVPVAWVKYKNTVPTNGWSYLSVAASEDDRVSRELKMYAAGFLEGYVSTQQMRDFRHNAGKLMQAEEDKHHALENIKDVFGKGLETLCAKSGLSPSASLVDAQAPADPWWRQARLSLMQAWGILDAYNARASDVQDVEMSMVDLLILSSDGETPELEMAYDSEESLLRQSQHDGASGDDSVAPSSNTSKAQVLLQRSRRRGHRRDRRSALGALTDRSWRRIKDSTGRCSALVRLTKDNADLMVGHTTFSDYSEMTRVFKYYDLPLGEGVRRMGFSSYPGVAGSTDDYYLLDSGLVITETTISMLTDEPYDKLDDTVVQVPDFMRIMIANRLAKTGPEWTEMMTRTSTGTYSSQWMVVDYNAFSPGRSLKEGTLLVLEQVPGFSRSADMSQHLQDSGYWASENRAWFKDVRDRIGASEAEELHGKLFSAEHNPRANIFAATAPQVQSLADMRDEMRRNRWPNEVDGGEGNTPDHAISARGDLDKDSPNANGGVDAKVTNSCLARLLRCDAISGPTAATQKPFQWADETGRELFPGAPHDGLPNTWNFDWVRMAPDAAGAESLSEAAAGLCNT